MYSEEQRAEYSKERRVKYEPPVDGVSQRVPTQDRYSSIWDCEGEDVPATEPPVNKSGHE